MAAETSEEQVYEQARERPAAKGAFYLHLAIDLIASILLILIWAFVAGGGSP